MALRNPFAGFNTNSWLGSNLKRGAGEAFGIHYERVPGDLPGSSKLMNRGFMNKDAMKAAWESNKVAGKATLKSGTKALGAAFVPGLSLAFTLHGAFSGYKEGGLKGAGESIAQNIAFNTGLSMLGGMAGSILGGVGSAIGVGLGAYALGEAGKAKRKRITGLEMSSVGADSINTQGAFTSRQRAMQALNDSRINARMAIGNEASLMHTRYR